jgi:hypothetical protein
LIIRAGCQCYPQAIILTIILWDVAIGTASGLYCVGDHEEVTVEEERRRVLLSIAVLAILAILVVYAAVCFFFLGVFVHDERE